MVFRKFEQKFLIIKLLVLLLVKILIVMRIEEIIQLLDAKILCGHNRISDEISNAFSSDLMSDVLIFEPVPERSRRVKGNGETMNRSTGP